MGINSKISKVPFFILYLILATLTLYNWVRVVLFQTNFEIFRIEQPWDYYLSNFFSSFFGITHQQYFLFSLPIILLILYFIPIIFGRLLNLDKKSNIKGDNHLSLIIILLIIPGVFDFPHLFGSSWQSHLSLGLLLVILFSIWSWIDEKRHKTN